MGCSVYFILLIFTLPLLVRNCCCCDNSFININETVCLLEKLGHSGRTVASALSQCSVQSPPGYYGGSQLPVEASEVKNFISKFDKHLLDSSRSFKEKTGRVQVDLDKDEVVCKNNKRQKIFPRNCYELQKMGDNKSGLKTVYMDSTSSHPFQVRCDQDTDGGGWTIIQRRINLPIRENFDRSFREYEIGFGNMSGEFWIGLDKMHHLTKSFLSELRIDMDDFDGNSAYDKYGFFYVNSAAENYKLNIRLFEGGNAGDAMSHHNDIRFSAHDLDLDPHKGHCGQYHKSGFWFTTCYSANLNGPPSNNKNIVRAQGIIYEPFKGFEYGLKKVEMKIRPKYPYEFPPINEYF